MAKVTITATAQIRDGLMCNEQSRASVLEVFGKNDKLLRDIKELFEQGVVDKFARVKIMDGVKFYVVLRYIADQSALAINVIDTSGRNVGSAIYGKTKFFACLENATGDDEE